MALPITALILDLISLLQKTNINASSWAKAVELVNAFSYLSTSMGNYTVWVYIAGITVSCCISICCNSILSSWPWLMPFSCKPQGAEGLWQSWQHREHHADMLEWCHYAYEVLWVGKSKYLGALDRRVPETNPAEVQGPDTTGKSVRVQRSGECWRSLLKWETHCCPLHHTPWSKGSNVRHVFGILESTYVIFGQAALTQLLGNLYIWQCYVWL